MSVISMSTGPIPNQPDRVADRQQHQYAAGSTQHRRAASRDRAATHDAGTKPDGHRHRLALAATARQPDAVPEQPHGRRIAVTEHRFRFAGRFHRGEPGQFAPLERLGHDEYRRLRTRHLASQVSTIIQGLVNTANTTFQGQYLFGGSNTQTAPFQILGNGTVRYNGDQSSINSNVDVGACRSQ